MISLGRVNITPTNVGTEDESLAFSIGSITLPKAALKAAYDAYPLNMVGQIKLIKAFTGLGLAEAKDMADAFRVLRLMA